MAEAKPDKVCAVPREHVLDIKPEGEGWRVTLACGGSAFLTFAVLDYLALPRGKEGKLLFNAEDATLRCPECHIVCVVANVAG